MDSRQLSTTSPAKRGLGGEVSATCPDPIGRLDEDQAGVWVARTSGHDQAGIGGIAPQMRPWRIA
jgi:hypothetical protein